MLCLHASSSLQNQGVCQSSSMSQLIGYNGHLAGLSNKGRREKGVLSIRSIQGSKRYLG